MSSSKATSESPLIVGIDMGTTNSAVAAMGADGSVRILGPGDAPTIPSIVRFDGQDLVASDGRQDGIDPENTFRGIKRLLGRKAHSEEVFASRALFRIASRHRRRATAGFVFKTDRHHLKSSRGPCSARFDGVRKKTSTNQSLVRYWRCRHTSTTLSAKRFVTPARWLGSKSCG